MGNTITDKLPQTFIEDREQEKIAIALTDGIADIIDIWLDEIANYESRYLDPRTAEPEWLDYLAYQLGWEGIWISSWQENVKRELLINTSYIWSIRGSRGILPYLMGIFGYEGELQQTTGWILGEEGSNATELPAPLLIDPFSYRLYFPYSEDSTQYETLTLLIENFVPCWVRISIESTPL